MAPQLPWPWKDQRWRPAIGIIAAIVAAAGTVLWMVATTVPRRSEIADAKQPEVLGFVTHFSGNTSLLDLERHRQDVTALCAFAVELTNKGGLQGAVDAHALHYARHAGLDGFITVANTTASGFDGRATAAILANRSKSAALANALAKLAKSPGCTGINIDFELLPRSARTDFTAFLARLHRKLAAEGRKLTVDVPAVTAAEAGYDYARIGQHADQLIVMAYDYAYPGSPPGPIAPVSWVDSVLRYATAHVPAQKLVLGIPAYGYDWPAKGTAQARTLKSIDRQLARLKVTPAWDAKAAAPFYRYREKGIVHTVYYENARSLAAKMRLAQKYGLGGVAIWHMGTEDRAIWQVIQKHARSWRPTGH